MSLNTTLASTWPGRTGLSENLGPTKWPEQSGSVVRRNARSVRSTTSQSISALITPYRLIRHRKPTVASITLATKPVSLEVFATVASEFNDDLRSTQSSPVNNPLRPYDPSDGAFFSTASLEADINMLIKMTKKAALDIRRAHQEELIALGSET